MYYPSNMMIIMLAVAGRHSREKGAITPLVFAQGKKKVLVTNIIGNSKMATLIQDIYFRYKQKVKACSYDFIPVVALKDLLWLDLRLQCD